MARSGAAVASLTLIVDGGNRDGRTGRGPRHLVTATVAVEADPEDVWHVLCDVHRYPDWLENTIEVRRGEVLDAVGSTYAERARLSGMWTAELVWTVTDFVRPTLLRMTGDGARPIRDLELEYRVERGDERTDVSSTYAYAPRFWPLGAVLQLVVRSNVVADQCRSLRTLARVAEELA